MIPLKNVITDISRYQYNCSIPPIPSFQQLFTKIEDDDFRKLQFTHDGKQFYQEKFTINLNSQAIVFGNKHIINQVSDSQIMYVDASFRIDTNEQFKYHLITVLVWVGDSYYPVYFGLVTNKCREIYKLVLQYLHDNLAPTLRPKEIITDFEANLYYALGEIYVNSTIGGSIFYYTQNLYKKICTLNLSKDLETKSHFRNIYNMFLMLPLLPVNTIVPALNNIEAQAQEFNLETLMKPMFNHIRNEWINKVTPNFFCVHKIESRINENVTAPFKKFRDYLLLSKGKSSDKVITVTTLIEKLIDLEYFLQLSYSAPTKKPFARDSSSTQRKHVLKAWQFIEKHPKININNFANKVVGYIKCMENQLWIWGFYRYSGDINDELINAKHFSFISRNGEEEEEDDLFFSRNSRTTKALDTNLFNKATIKDNEYLDQLINDEEINENILIEATVDENGLVQISKSS